MNDSPPPSRENAAPRAIIATLIIGCVLIGLKTWAWVETGYSAAVLASLLDSAVDVGVSVLNGLAILYALRPADAGHRHGHGKAEGLSALVQAVFIAAGAGFLGVEALGRILTPVSMEMPLFAAGIVAISSLGTLAILYVQRRALERTASMALEADHAHYFSDIALSAAVVATLVASWAGAPFWLDGAFGLVATLVIAHAGWGVGKKALDMLLDAELPSSVLERVEAIARSHPSVLGFHDVRSRRTGIGQAFALDLEMDPHMTLADAHAAGSEVEAAIIEAFPHAEIMIHLDPYGVPHKDSRHST